MIYEVMSDFEINSAVHNIVRDLGYDLEFLGGDQIKWYGVGKEIVTSKCDYSKNGLRDYCNNPSDAWPIIVGSRIGLVFVNGAWRASSLTVGYDEFKHENPLRAAMIVFLMIKDAECQKS